MIDTTTSKERLVAELALVTEELKGLGIHNPDNADDWIATPVGTEVAEADSNVHADHAEELEEREAILADLELRYNAIRGALARIDAGTFGVCEICNGPIEDTRLEAYPAARTCIEHREEEATLS